MSGGLSAGFGPQRGDVPAALQEVSTGGFYPRQVRQALQDQVSLRGVSEFDASTIIVDEQSPIIGTALHYHDGIRPQLTPKLGLSKEERYYEEDPETDRFLELCTQTITPNQSRFEFDGNRPPDTTVYSKPSLSWGMQTWREPLTAYEKEFTMGKWYELHTMVDALVEASLQRFGVAVVLDFHSYNYQRKEYVDWRTDEKPVMNLGTRHLVLDKRTQALKDQVVADMKGFTVEGDPCLVEENGVFYGGYLNRRLAHLFGPKVLTLSLEWKKVYMDERTGEIYEPILQDLVKQMNGVLGNLADTLGAPLRECGELPHRVLGRYGQP